MYRAPPNEPRIIVGVNDTPGARWAPAWALGESRLHHLPVHLVHACQETTRLEHRSWFTTIDATAQVAAANMLTRVLKEVAVASYRASSFPPVCVRGGPVRPSPNSPGVPTS